MKTCARILSIMTFCLFVVFFNKAHAHELGKQLQITGEIKEHANAEGVRSFFLQPRQGKEIFLCPLIGAPDYLFWTAGKNITLEGALTKTGNGEISFVDGKFKQINAGSSNGLALENAGEDAKSKDGESFPVDDKSRQADANNSNKPVKEARAENGTADDDSSHALQAHEPGKRLQLTGKIVPHNHYLRLQTLQGDEVLVCSLYECPDYLLKIAGRGKKITLEGALERHRSGVYFVDGKFKLINISNELAWKKPGKGNSHSTVGMYGIFIGNTFEHALKELLDVRKKEKLTAIYFKSGRAYSISGSYANAKIEEVPSHSIERYSDIIYHGLYNLDTMYGLSSKFLIDNLQIPGLDISLDAEKILGILSTKGPDKRIAGTKSSKIDIISLYDSLYTIDLGAILFFITLPEKNIEKYLYSGMFFARGDLRDRIINVLTERYETVQIGEVDKAGGGYGAKATCWRAGNTYMVNVGDFFHFYDANIINYLIADDVQQIQKEKKEREERIRKDYEGI